ncbi:MAG: CBS domain-containing protein [Trueperaceae bacterium]
MLVRDWMTADPQTVTAATPVMEAMQKLRDGGYRRLPVVREGKLVGIVTDRDLKEATPSKATSLSVYELNYLLSKLTIKDVMTAPVMTIGSEDAIEEAALMMESHRVSGLPVVDHGKLVGILTITDLLRAFVRFLGLREGGMRVTVDLPDEPGVLARAAEAAAPSNVVAVVTAGVSEGHRRRLVLRVAGEDVEGFPERLKAKGIEVRDVR